MGGQRDRGDPEIAEESTGDVASVADVIDKFIEVFVAADDSLVDTELSAEVDVVKCFEADEVEVDVVEVDVVEVDVVDGFKEVHTASFSVVAKVVDVLVVIITPSAKVDETVEVDVGDSDDAEGGKVGFFGVGDDFAVDDSRKLFGMNRVTGFLIEVAVANVVEVLERVDDDVEVLVDVVRDEVGDKVVNVVEVDEVDLKFIM